VALGLDGLGVLAAVPVGAVVEVRRLGQRVVEGVVVHSGLDFLVVRHTTHVAGQGEAGGGSGCRAVQAVVGAGRYAGPAAVVHREAGGQLVGREATGDAVRGVTLEEGLDRGVGGVLLGARRDRRHRVVRRGEDPGLVVGRARGLPETTVQVE